jgi:hypothetical protein
MHRTRPFLAVAALLALPAISSAALLYSEDFEANPTANWTVNKSNATGSSANFFFDYNTVGIPASPGSGTGTRAIRLDANVTPTNVLSGISVSPIGQSFTGDYRLTAQVWLNFIGPAPTGGSGSTEAGGLGIGTNGATPQWSGGVQNSVHFSTTLDGNSSVDWRAYSTAAGTGYLPASGVFFAGTGASPDSRNNSHPYYAGFGNVLVPAAQTTLFPSQTGSTLVGSAGFTWQEMVVEKSGNFITWTVAGLPIAKVDASTVTLSGTNILFNFFDTNATSSTDTTGMNFALFDNIKVESIPEPTSLSLLALTSLAALRRRR